MTNDSTASTPQVVLRYLASADARDSAALAECFTVDGTVVDEGKTYVGREAIKGWRDALAGQWTYTTAVTGSEPDGAGGYQVSVHIEGNFPGGEADLTYAFEVDGDLIEALYIG